MIGIEAYNEVAVDASRNLTVSVINCAAREADIRPGRTAQLRIKKHLAKRLAKKVKLAKLKGKKLKMKKSI